MVAAPTLSLEAAICIEIDRWRRLGVAVLPGPRGKKGPREQGWPTIPHERAGELAYGERCPNLVVHTGPTADRGRSLAAIDLDGKCPCGKCPHGHDRSAHGDADSACSAVRGHAEATCDCGHYRGVAPELALARLLGALPSRVAVSRTARGFHIIFWVATPVPDGLLPELSADLFGGLTPHGLQVPPSSHPKGVVYEWLREPTSDLAMADLQELGLVPEQVRGDARPHRQSADRLRPATASPARQSEFVGPDGRPRCSCPRSRRGVSRLPMARRDRGVVASALGRGGLPLLRLR